MEDTTYKLRKIKFHRLVYQIEKDISNLLYTNSNKTIQEILEEKYPGIKVDTNYNGEFTQTIYVTIPRPLQKICVKLTITPDGIK